MAQPFTVVGPGHDSVLLLIQQGCQEHPHCVLADCVLVCHSIEPQVGGRFLTPPGSVPALSLQRSNEDIIEVLAHGPHYTTYWVRVPVHQAGNTVQCLSELRAGPGRSPHPGPQDEQGGQEQAQVWASQGLPTRVSTVQCTRESGLPLLPPATWDNRKTLLTYL